MCQINWVFYLNLNIKEAIFNPNLSNIERQLHCLLKFMTARFDYKQFLVRVKLTKNLSYYNLSTLPAKYIHKGKNQNDFYALNWNLNKFVKKFPNPIKYSFGGHRKVRCHCCGFKSAGQSLF